MAEFDGNFRTIRDFSNGLASLMGVSLNPDGSIKTGAITTAAIVDRSITQAKLAWFANFFGVAAGVDTYTTTINPTAGFGYGDGAATSFLCLIRFTNANTGVSTLNINGTGARTIKKFGNQDLDAGDIMAGQVHLLGFDGANFQLLSTLANTIDRAEMKVLQKVVDTTAAQPIASTAVPGEGMTHIATAPVIGEGVQAFTINFTPKSAGSTIKIEFDGNILFVYNPTGVFTHGMAIAAAFQDAGPNAIAAVALDWGTTTDYFSSPIRLVHYCPSVNVTPRDYSIRFGPVTAGYAQLNTMAGPTNFGGVLYSHLCITEFLEI
jgi:hypothetical protein